MKKLLTSALVMVLAVGVVQAQNTSADKTKGQRKEQKDGRKGDKEDHNKMYDRLNLTADQKARLQTLREDYKRQSEELRKNTSLSAEQKQARRKELQEQYKTQTSDILTPAQREQAEKMKSEWKSKEKKKGKLGKSGNGVTQGKGFDRGAAFQQDLNLTQEQQARVQQIRNDYKSKFEALRADKSLTQEQKRVKMQELMKAQHAQVKTVLTKEQIEKMEASRKERFGRNTK
jgi:Spy/CpxP family protein refolding chaperone